ncbi:hypothetical protein CVIRNUC_009069 [Coccomyxa viridis]|uniref:Glutamine cyclotransferase n=1 Tax=Coccomyxa viridis TaxID=1274662 RepID=A0AAV1IGP4_9CHLO|nr:hypothetical protein CVIRNUC_009069 [Coccomyxa viridis]
MAKKQRTRRLQAGSQQPAEVAESAGEGRSLSTMARMCILALGALLLLGFLMSALGQSIPFLSDLTQSEAPASASPSSGPQLYSYDIIETYPHDPNAFTQGLDYDKVDGADAFWESTGMYGQSTVRLVDLKTGDVIKEHTMDPSDFGEGLTKLGNTVYQEIWKSGKLYEYPVANLDNVKSAAGPLSDGWGLTTDQTSLIMSDGSSTLSWVDPQSLAVQRTISVTDGGQGVNALNELEWVDGEVWANIWLTNCIARIDPTSGAVKGWITLSSLTDNLKAQNLAQTNPMDVLNGIAWDKTTGRVFVTGKYWPRLYSIKARLTSANPNAFELLSVRHTCIKSSAGV